MIPKCFEIAPISAMFSNPSIFRKMQHTPHENLVFEVRGVPKWSQHDPQNASKIKLRCGGPPGEPPGAILEGFGGPKRLPRGSRELPGDAGRAPGAPQEAQSEPQEVQNEPQEAQNEPQEAQHEPQETQHELQEAQNEPQEAQIEPPEIQNELPGGPK